MNQHKPNTHPQPGQPDKDKSRSVPDQNDKDRKGDQESPRNDKDERLASPAPVG